MTTLLYAVGLAVSLLIIYLTSAVLFQHNAGSLQLAAQFSGLLLSGFSAVYCFIRLVYRLFVTISRIFQGPVVFRKPRAAQAVDKAPFVRPIRNQSLPQSRFAQALMKRRNMSYEENQQQNQRHGQQMVNRIITNRSDRQQKFTRWPQERTFGVNGNHRYNRFGR